ESDVKAVCTEQERASAYAEFGIRNEASARLTRALTINASKMGSPAWRISDDVQDTLEKILRKCKEILSGRHPNIPGFVLKTLRNDGIDKWRKAERETKGLENYEANFAVGLANSAAAEARENAVLAELAGKLPELTRELSPRQKDVLLKWVSDKGTQQTAEE